VRVVLAVAGVCALIIAIVMLSSSTVASEDNPTTTSSEVVAEVAEVAVATTELMTTTTDPVTTTTSLATTTTETSSSPEPLPVSCSDFGSQDEAQAWHDEHKHEYVTHVSSWDSNGDGKPCTTVCYGECSAPAAPLSSPGGGIGSAWPQWPWPQLASCESGQDPLAVGGKSGQYLGAYQFLQSTWVSWGGTQYAPTPHGATIEEQTLVAANGVASQGNTFRAFPGCRAKLGLP